jgi:hypothetical protein
MYMQLLQQRINRGQRRLARMTGRAPPSLKQLRNNLLRRLQSIDGLGRTGRRSRKSNPRRAHILDVNNGGNSGFGPSSNTKSGNNHTHVALAEDDEPANSVDPAIAAAVAATSDAEFVSGVVLPPSTSTAISIE